MCRFCVEHGEGERWYLNAQNYAHDLNSDLRRRDYVVGFIGGFGETRSSALRWVDRLDRLPAPLSRVGRELVSRRMQAKHFGQPVPIEECARIFDLSTSITLIPCVCRMHTPGQRADEVCILVTTQPVDAVLEEGFRDYQNGPDARDFQRLTKPQAMDLLAQCERDGLMHSAWTFLTPFTAAICNCNLESGCMAMQMSIARDVKVMWRGEWVATLDDERCTRCGACVRRCPFDAIVANGQASVDPAKCWGCGICRSACRVDALALVDRREVPAVADLW
ncbi:MAG: 4Fe-4S binding protein [Coriobacteriia bacterium]|nr:4Fe-4S binding protein [Coriobacteriia bacterium]